ncbi:hypothetical protein [Enterovibrio calviensis]|uniref:hypothetical protein n=1 Tax=Enterovibrio calviensis TaxID=91359 RepID=UPI000484A812|nr:hypothetical protein [Enterovibrio calviensis]
MALIYKKAYRALMPRLYHQANVKQKLHIEALKFPNVRVMGPFWSFGIKIRTFEKLKEANLPDNSLYALNLMQEHTEDIKLVDEEKRHTMHRPQLFQATVDSFYSYDSKALSKYFPNDDPEYPGASRLSIIGVHTLYMEEEGMSLSDLLNHTPVKTGQQPKGDTTAMILATIGGDPVYEKQNTFYLPACQLINGRIGFRPTPHYLRMLRNRLGLNALDITTDSIEEGDSGLVYLLPDGFALFGMIKVPWQDSAVGGWFKVSKKTPQTQGNRHSDSVAELSVWTETPHPNTIYSDAAEPWSKALPTLKTLMFNVRELNEGPKWLTLNPSGVLDTSDFFWPIQQDVNYLENNHNFNFLLQRMPSEDHRIFIREQALVAKLANRSQTDTSLSVLTMKPPSFKLYRHDERMVLRSSITSGPEIESTVSRLRSEYTYSNEQTTDKTKGENQSESLLVAEYNHKGKKQALELAVPLIRTAAMLREAQQIPEPEHLNQLIWSFIPTTSGWLHLPFPNVTLTSLDLTINPKSAESEATHVNQESTQSSKKNRNSMVSGAIGFQNRPDAPGFSHNQRIWSFSLTDIEDATLSVDFDLKGNEIAKANVTLFGGDIVFDGVLPITPFRQSPERLLPDHAERALSTRSILAVSPHMLRDVEAKTWSLKHNNVPVLRTSLRVHHLKFSAGASDAPAVIENNFLTLVTDISPDTLENPNDARAPWIWIRQHEVPTVQTMPLALAGKERRTPSGSRELAPLRLKLNPINDMGDFTSTTLEYTFLNALDMTKSAISFSRCGNWERPTNMMSWCDEVGMVFLGLPSIVAYPGLASYDQAPQRIPIRTLQWGDKPAVETKHSILETPIEIRCDLAWRDEAYATSTIPKNQSKKNNQQTALNHEPAAPRLFLPRRDNGPDKPTREDWSDAVWHSVWSGLQKDLALSATDRRTLVSFKLVSSESDESKKQAQYYLHTDGYTASPVKMKLCALTTITAEREAGDHSFHEGGPAPWWLKSVGTWSFDDDKKNLHSVEGLPSEGDLIGQFAKLDASGNAFQFGTATLKASETREFHDQRGLLISPHQFEFADTTIARELQVHGEKVTLLSAKKPYSCDANTSLRFWFSDVPLEESSKELHPRARLDNNNEQDNWSRHTVNANSYLNTPFQGFRWWLGYNEEIYKTDVITVDGIRFTPLTLHNVKRGKDELTIEIIGQPFLLVNTQNPDTVPPRGSDGLLKLVLTISGDTFTSRFETFNSTSIRWPLAYRAGFDDPVPVLTLKQWPNTDVPSEDNGELQVTLLGTTLRIPLKVHFEKQGTTRSLKAVFENNNCHKGELTVCRAFIDAEENGLGQLALKAADLKIKATISDSLNSDIYIYTTITLDLKQPSMPVTHADGTVTTPLFSEAVNIRVAPETVVMDNTGLHFLWNTGNEKVVDSEPFTPSSIQGIFSAGISLPSIEKDKKDRGEFRFRLNNAVLEAKATLSVFNPNLTNPKASTQSSLTLQKTRSDNNFRLYGSIPVQNFFTWPEIAMPDDLVSGWNKLELDASSTEIIKHTANIILEGQPFHRFSGKNLKFAARVKHSLHWGGRENDRPQLSWIQYQVVRLLNVQVLSSNLRKLDEGHPDRGECSIFAIIKPKNLNLEDTNLSKMLFRQKVAKHSALNGTLRQKWLDENVENGLVVDLSAHHQLDFAENGERDWVVLPLPFSSILTANRWQPDDEFLDIFRTKLAHPESIWVHGTDLPLPGTIARPSREMLSQARKSVTDTTHNKHPGDAPACALGLPELLASNDAIVPYETRSVFQSFVLIKRSHKTVLAGLHYPALHQVLILGVLGKRKPDNNPQGFTFSQGGSSAAPTSESGETNLQSLLASMKHYAQSLAGHLVASPTSEVNDAQNDAKSSKSESYELIVHVAARDGRKILELSKQQIKMTIEGEDNLQREKRWAYQTIQRLAPWSSSGTLTRRHNDGDSDFFVISKDTEKALSSAVKNIRPSAATPLPRLTPPQAQRITPPSEKNISVPDYLVAGFSPIRTQAALWASEDNVLFGTETDGPRLTATASETVWQLHHGAAAYLTKSGEKKISMRMHNRTQVSFREAEVWHEKQESQRLTSALPDNFQARLPDGMLPTAHLHKSPDETASYMQTILPGRSFTARLADRAGAWADTRLGLDFSGLRASEVPINIKLPRPPLLAANDRTRASSHEKGEIVAAGTDPLLILHGPRAQKPSINGSYDGLDRSPRSAWASSFKVGSPSRGLIGREWNGVLSFELLAGTSLEKWLVNKAEARLEGEVFSLDLQHIEKILNTAQKAAQGEIEHQKVTLAHDLYPFSLSTKQSLLSAAMSKPPATPIEVIIEVKSDGDNSIERQLRFELLTASGELSSTEIPVYLRFDDPEYNDRLNGIAKMDFCPVGVAEKVDLVFAADLNDVRKNDRLELALGLRQDDSEETNASITFGGGSISNNIATLKDNVLELAVYRNRTSNGQPQNEEMAKFGWPNAIDGRDHLSYTLELDNYELLPDDILELRVVLKTASSNGKDNAKMHNQLFFDVVDKPLHPQNPSNFAMLQLSVIKEESEVKDTEKKDKKEQQEKPTEKYQLSAPLYAASPSATILEIVDPQDLLDGIVRRRAIYQWRSFIPRQQTYLTTVQKIAASGSSWIDPDLAEGWIRVGEND